MTVNESQKKYSQNWDKWRAAGALGTIEDACKGYSSNKSKMNLTDSQKEILYTPLEDISDTDKTYVIPV